MPRLLARLALKDKPTREKLQLIRRMVDGVRENPDLMRMPAHFTELELLLAETEELVTDVELARMALREKVSRRNARLKRLCLLASCFKSGVQSFSRSDPATLLGAGLELMADIKPIGEMPAPQNMSAMPGSHAGTVLLRWKRVPRRLPTYVVQFATRPDDADGWVQLPAAFTKCKRLIEELEPGTLYWFRVAAMGTAGIGPWSPIASARAA